ncbi:hypothetical protein [Streptomyces sp. 8ZJF_21]|uniref:hypothetical protein n=1 Tax=Streptomyces sp. 8ZJF_21 TaxID=2903141 RepID=UPI001E3D31E7|nr:hypothetical protein [Streptomyces sp. 8ZJF_21]MCD9592817.1 hypothetical protein [Streptomyces sp. 8ZJF_21]
MKGLRTGLWCAAVISFGAAVFAYQSGAKALLALCLVLGVILPGVAEVYADRRQKRDWYARHFSSSEEARSSLDEYALRRLRDKKGAAVAVRELRRTYPKMPLAEAARLIKEL